MISDHKNYKAVDKSEDRCTFVIAAILGLIRGLSFINIIHGPENRKVHLMRPNCVHEM